MKTDEILAKCVALVKEKKATAISVLHMSALTSICDYFLLATAANIRLAKALCDYIEEECENLGCRVSRIEGYADGRWILMDYGFLIIHIFQEEERQYYNLERLWKDAPRNDY